MNSVTTRWILSRNDDSISLRIYVRRGARRRRVDAKYALWQEKAARRARRAARSLGRRLEFVLRVPLHLRLGALHHSCCGRGLLLVGAAAARIVRHGVLRRRNLLRGEIVLGVLGDRILLLRHLILGLVRHLLDGLLDRSVH